MTSNKNSVYKKLRRKYPVFTYEDFSYHVRDNNLHLNYYFNLYNKYEFQPKYVIPLKNWSVKGLPGDLLRNLVFHIGMVELVSYWKATCSPTVDIKPFKLSVEEKNWWKRLYFLGLGEFFHLNGIDANEDDFMTFADDYFRPPVPGNIRIDNNDGIIIPVGGGKDSLVSLAILQQDEHEKIGFAINPGQATLASIKLAGLEENFFQVERSIDPRLLDLNSKGFLNGHTPFSSLVAFVSALAAAITRHRFIALSNESSANEATIPGTNINHQYSKSIQFEKDFRWYLRGSVSPDINYFSLLRPLNELQIAAVFAANPAYHLIFRSCNVGSKTNTWCCNCPKCLFTYIMLAPFLDSQHLVKIFGENLLEKESLRPLLEQLCGLAPEKPFECVGTMDEVNSALAYVAQTKKTYELPGLVQYHKKYTDQIIFSSLHSQLNFWNPVNNLTQRFEDLVKNGLTHSINRK